MAFSFVLATVAAVAYLHDRFPDHLAMSVVANHRAPRLKMPAANLGHTSFATKSERLAATTDPLAATRPWWNRIGFGPRPPSKPVVGKKAWIQWWERLRSLVLLTAVVAALGLLLAATIGLIIFSLGFLLEQAVS